jgi:transcriptional regulator NrdR family protein
MTERQRVSLEKQIGLECRRCGCQHLAVLYTRRRSGGKIMRRRQCRHCGTRMTTYEVLPGRVGDAT